MRRLTPDEGLVEIRDLQERLSADRRQEALDEAAASYTESTPGETSSWYPDALALLEAAGADLERARHIHGTRLGGGLAGLGEQAARLPRT